MSRITILPGLCGIFLAAPLIGSDLHVPADFPTIQGAIDGALEGDRIIVAAGEYRISASLRFKGKSIEVRGAGAAASTIRMDPRTAEGTVVTFDAGEDDDGILEGFTITGGTGTSEGTNYGGGIRCLDGTHPTLRGLAIVENRATYGGALHCRRSKPAIIGCDLSRNHVTCGGGAYCDDAAPRFIGCRIVGNRGAYASSGIHSKNGSTPYLEGCWIAGNTTYYGGGVDAFQSTPTLVNCVLAGNTATMGGAAYATPGTLRLIHCTIIGNSSSLGSGAIEGTPAGTILEGCIVSGNDPPTAAFTAVNCLVGEDPRFVDPGSFSATRYRTVDISGEEAQLPDFIVRWPDLHLRPGSPGIDRIEANSLISADLEGTRRPCGLRADLGAFETCIAPAAFLRADATGDGRIDVTDPVGILGHLFLREPEDLPCAAAADSDDDGLLCIADAIAALGFLFGGSPVPPAPFPECGEDPAPEGLGCGTSPCSAAE